MTNQSKINQRIKHRLLFSTVMFLFASMAFAQTINVSGTVKDTSGPLPGVSVVVKGTTKGAATDFDGNYSLTDVPSNATLVFTYLGYFDKEIPVNGQTTINVVLEQDTEQLEEVVVVGYGTQRKEAVTGSVASITGATLTEVPTGNVTQALQGRVAGVELTQTSTKPGANMQIRIRGQRSLTGSNDPLIVLDGIPFAGAIGDINPNDIKSMDILKDASATAIYGSRGANGVILITTFKGNKGQKAQFSYNSFYGVKEVFADYPMMNGAQFVKLREAAGLFTNAIDEANDVDTDWQDLLYGTGMVTTHDVTVSGGTEHGSYLGGIGYYKEEAVVPLQDYQRFSLRGSLDQEVGNAFRVGFTSNNNYSITNGDNIGPGGTLSATPITNPYNDDGSLKRTVESAIDQRWVYTRETLNALGDSYINQARAFSSYNNLYGEVQIPWVEGLKYRVNVGLNYRATNNGYYEGFGVFDYNETTTSNANISNSWSTQWLIENIISYDRTFADKHTVNFVGLYSNEQLTSNSSFMSRTGITSDAFQFYNLGQSEDEVIVDPNRQDYTQWGIRSWMARLMYSYDNRYFISGTVRSDGSSRLAPGHQWNTYPAISVGWNISNEAFMNDVAWLDLLKLRVGYGETSNQAVAPYSTLGKLNTRPYNFGDIYSTGLYVSEAPNPELGWEFSETWNYGLDFGFFNNRLTGTFEYYVTNTKEILQRVSLPTTAGVGSYVANIGETENKGFEISLNGVILDTPDGLTWTAGFNLYANNNKLTALASGADRDEGNWWFVGHNINSIYDYEYQGLWQEGDPYLDILEPGGNVGMIKVKYTGEYNPDGTPVRAIGADDRQVIDTDPDFQGGFNTTLTYKGFDFTAVGAFKSGGVLISTLYSSNGYINQLSGRNNNVDVDYWTPENTGARYPKPGGIMVSDNPKYGSTLGYFDAGYLKIRALTLGYTFNQSFIKDAGISKFRLYFTAQNPFVLFSPYYDHSGMDPETNSFANQNAAVNYNDNLSRFTTIGTNTPSTRNYVLGLNLTF